MIAADAMVSQAVAVEFGVDLKDGPLWFALSLVMIALVFFAARQRRI